MNAKTQGNHSPLPWRVDDNIVEDWDFKILSDGMPENMSEIASLPVEGSGETSTELVQEANAELIVRCVNQHDGLVEALEAIKARINGEWDNPALVKHGPLHASTTVDILGIIAGAESRQREGK